MGLLSKIDISQNDNLYNIEYFEILKKIIQERMSVEHYSIKAVIAEYNNQFSKRINRNIDDAYQMMRRDLTDDDSQVYSEIQSWISSKFKYKQDEYTQYTIRQFTNMFLFIRTYPMPEDEYIISNEDEMASSLFSLTKKENRILCEFWDRCIIEYEKYSLTDAIDDVKTVANSQLRYAEWPAPASLTIDGITYKHYLFCNKNPRQGSDPYPDDEDEDLGIDYETTEPEIPDECEIMQAPQEFLMDNEDDP